MRVWAFCVFWLIFFFALINMLLRVVCILWFSAGIICFFLCILSRESKSSKPVPPSFTPELESCPNSYQVWFLFSVDLCFFFFTYALWFCVFVGISLQKNQSLSILCILVDFFFCINKSIILCSVCILWFSIGMIFCVHFVYSVWFCNFCFCVFCVMCIMCKAPHCHSFCISV